MLGLGAPRESGMPARCVHLAVNGPKCWAPGSDQPRTLALTVAKTMAENKAAQPLPPWNVLKELEGRGGEPDPDDSMKSYLLL